MIRRLIPLVLAAGCADDGKLLSKLDGEWQGEFVDGATTVPMLAEFEWRKDEDLLFGQVSIQVPGEAAASIWAVRRWDVQGDEAFLDLTDGADITRGMDLDGPVSDKSFSGSCDISIPCPAGNCGYAGRFELSPGGPGLTTPPTPTTDTGA